MKPDPAAGDAGSQGAAANRPDAYLLAGQDVFERYGTRPGGLTAGEVASQRDRYGDNVIVEVVRELAVLGYLRQFKDWMIVLLLACAAITAYLGDILIASVLLALVLLNTLIGFVQEYRAGRTMASLERLVEPSSQVVRDGAIVVVPSHELVIGDVVRLEAGASVPADIRLVETSAFSTNEFALTGESDPTRKHSRAIVHAVPVADRRNMAYAGTTVATGEGLGVVVGTGRGTELGRIAHLSQSAPRVASPMQREIGHIARFITVVAVALALALLVVAVWFELPFREALLFAVGFATAVIPQGLPAEISTSLAQAAGGLARRGALVKKLSAVETLGATHVICTDKTGTLTENEMTVTELVAARRSFVVSGTGYEPVGEIVPVGEGETLDDGAVGDVRALLTSAVLASNAQLMAPDADHVGWWVLGDPTEGALVVAARKAGLDGSGSSPAEVREHPFDSSRKLMSSVRVDGDRLVAYVKGAPESVVHAATHIADARGVRAITDADRTSFLDGHIEKSGRGLRNLAIAKRELTADEAGRDEPSAVERDLVLLGLVSMTDPLRAAVPEAMAAALGAQIRVDVITGDYSRTAEAIARQAGLEGVAGLRTVTGTELAAMSDDEVLDLALAGGTVFSRVDPEDKTRIVDLVRRSGRVVAVTGDGINDAPALRHASIGVAMGATGTDVAKDAADVVLLDDSFSTLVTAIRYGRVIYGNITKGIVACLTSNTAELFVNLASLALFALAGVPFAINVLQILAIDLLGELFPIAALGRDPEQEDTMRRPPREPRRRILRGRTIGDIVYAGGVIGALAIGNYLLAYLRVGIDPFGGVSDAAVIAYATTVTYTTILVCQFANIVQRRSHHGLFSRYQLSNPVFWLACALGVSVMLVIVYVPVVSRAFGTAPLGLEDWALVVAAAAIFLVVREVGRIVRGGVRPHPV